MKSTKKLWFVLLLTFVASFSVLIWSGKEIYQEAPPIPEKIATTSGKIIYGSGVVMDGQQAWFSAGGQQLGSVWGHGAYVAPDWSADWLHREILELRDILAKKKYGRLFADLPVEEQASISALVKQEMRTNTYDEATQTITISEERAEAVRIVADHYIQLFGDNEEYRHLREQYAMKEDTLPSLEFRQQLSAFFFWSSWAAATERPNEDITYTNNWPHEPLIDNTPSASLGIWSIASVILLIAGIAFLSWYHFKEEEDEAAVVPEKDPLFSFKNTPSMKAVIKYFYVVIALFLVQVILGSITAHYAVEGQHFFGIELAKYLPYSVVRSWHTQLSVLWIATAWLATGLYIAPLISNYEPKFQRFGVNFLFFALLFLVVGSLGFGWLGTMQHLNPEMNFWIGSQGLEFTNMGRMWQYLLFIGLLLWLVLLGRSLWPVLKTPSKSRGIIGLLFLSAVCIGLFYITSLIWGSRTHYAIIEYWRWWLVHLWVEGFFEVFATVVIALIMSRLGLIRTSSAYKASLFATIIFLFGGIIGTLHHLYFTGAPTSIIAWGATFSALEVVPLALIGIEALQSYRLLKHAEWMKKYHWVIMFFVAVAFWNLVGAGLLGFAINPPLALYYVQGLNLTAAHAHAALFGVYGMLGIGLMLFCLRGLFKENYWNDTMLKYTFWSLNIGLAMMVFITLVPMGIYQTWESITKGLWYARSADVIRSDFAETLVWLRVPGDVVFAFGCLFLAFFAYQLLFKKSPQKIN
ncbi:nitric-oxide reductase large subunit [Ignatzschineria sp. LJL83]